jgi:hypothetical protein
LGVSKRGKGRGREGRGFPAFSPHLAHFLPGIRREDGDMMTGTSFAAPLFICRYKARRRHEVGTALLFRHLQIQIQAQASSSQPKAVAVASCRPELPAASSSPALSICFVLLSPSHTARNKQGTEDSQHRHLVPLHQSTTRNASIRARLEHLHRISPFLEIPKQLP